MTNYLEFEKPLAEIEGKAEELRAMARANPEANVEKEAAALDRKAAEMLRELYRTLTPWRKAQVARHPDRPHCRDYVEALFDEWTPLAGDRNFAESCEVVLLGERYCFDCVRAHRAEVLGGEPWAGKAGVTNSLTAISVESS